jgi:hypothetical protein
MKLSDIHQAFVSGIYHFDTDIAPASFIKRGKSLSPEESLGVYRGSVYGNLCSALAEIYPAFVQCVGEEFFQALALRYVKTHPSRSASLNHYGEEFSGFVRSFAPLESLPYAGDLAKLEWCWHSAFHAKDQCSLDPARLSGVAEEHYDDLIFSLPLSAHLIRSEYPIRDIWQKCIQDKGQNTDDELTFNELTLETEGQYILVWRAEGYDVRVEKLTILEFELLSLVKNKTPLGAILLELQSTYVDEDINQALARTVEQGWFVDALG